MSNYDAELQINEAAMVSSRYLIRVLSRSFHSRQIKHNRGPIRPKWQSRVRGPEVTMDTRGFSCAVSGVTRAKGGFFARRRRSCLRKVRPRRTTRGKPLVPRVSRGMLPLKF